MSARIGLALETKWLRFDERTRPPSQKTTVWWVYAKTSDVLLGEIKWYPPWRQYVFIPEAECLFNRTCLRDLAQFCESLMAARAPAAPPPPCEPLEKGGPVDHRVDMRTGACTCGTYRGPLLEPPR